MIQNPVDAMNLDRELDEMYKLDKKNDLQFIPQTLIPFK